MNGNGFRVDYPLKIFFGFQILNLTEVQIVEY